MKVGDFIQVKPLSQIYMLQLKYVNYKILVGFPEFDFKHVKGVSLFQKVHTGPGVPHLLFNGHRASSLDSKMPGV
jgi:hypothetical protein